MKSNILFQVNSELDYPTLHPFCYIINWASVIVNPAIYVATQSRYKFALRTLIIRLLHINNPRKIQQEMNALDDNRQIIIRSSKIIRQKSLLNDSAYHCCSSNPTVPGNKANEKGNRGVKIIFNKSSDL